MKVVVPPSSYLVENGRLEVLHPGEQQVGEDEEVGLGLEAVPRREAVVELHAKAQHLLDVGANLRLVHLAGRLRSSSRVDRLLLCSPEGGGGDMSQKSKDRLRDLAL